MMGAPARVRHQHCCKRAQECTVECRKRRAVGCGKGRGQGLTRNPQMASPPLGAHHGEGALPCHAMACTPCCTPLPFHAAPAVDVSLSQFNPEGTEGFVFAQVTLTPTLCTLRCGALVGSLDSRGTRELSWPPSTSCWRHNRQSLFGRSGGCCCLS